MKKGDMVYYEVISHSGSKRRVCVKICDISKNAKYPTIDLSNGHEAQWNGNKYIVKGMFGDPALKTH
jgi:hypothetical protein